MNTDLMFSSKNPCWCTPQDFFDKLNAEFHFTLDAAATEKSAKCPVYFTPETNALVQNWGVTGGGCLVQSSVWPKYKSLGAESKRGKRTSAYYRRNAHSRSNRYALFSRFYPIRKSLGGTLCKRSITLYGRGREAVCASTFSLSRGHIQAAGGVA